MKLLGVDWGEKRIGLAIASVEPGTRLDLAEPFGVVESVAELKRVIKQEDIEQVVLGLPEGKHQKAVKRLGRRLKEELGVGVVFRSEVLTSEQALQTAIKSGKKRKDRRNLDALAAAIILQEYLDSLSL